MPGSSSRCFPRCFPRCPGSLPGGVIFGTLFFLLLSVAALTSVVSLLEVVTAYLVDERKWPRRRAGAMVGGAAFLVGVPSALGYGAVGWLSAVTTVDGQPMAFLDLMHTIFGRLSLTLGALLTCVVVGWVWGHRKAREEVLVGNPKFRTLGAVWSFLLRFLCPVAIATILIFLILDPSAIR